MLPRLPNFMKLQNTDPTAWKESPGRLHVKGRQREPCAPFPESPTSLNEGMYLKLYGDL